MKLFFWTESEYEVCNHKMVFAETVEEARQMIVEDIRADYSKPDEFETLAQLQAQSEYYITSFLHDPKWQLTVYEIKPGIL